MLLLWGTRYLHTSVGTPLDVWRDYAEDLRGEAFDCGHFLAEEEPERTAAALAAFFGP
jgi:haloacetate dehalogenase